ncbi:hypothetical protein R0137_02020 [Congregibacter brevis]|uniref:2TM domain-containing protein n=1 Tax=Congregibacter brevis TaxID=3081201 RepID=A0ABZ0ICT3_9GAMM|nr:hypothetical protein R0137_02020 [Congregibacter sp. IMCC45268]
MLGPVPNNIDPVKLCCHISLHQSQSPLKFFESTGLDDKHHRILENVHCHEYYEGLHIIQIITWALCAATVYGIFTVAPWLNWIGAVWLALFAWLLWVLAARRSSEELATAYVSKANKRDVYDLETHEKKRRAREEVFDAAVLHERAEHSLIEERKALEEKQGVKAFPTQNQFNDGA